MSTEPNGLQILRLHKTWADRYMLLWQVFIFLLFAGVYFLFDQSGVGPAERTSAYVLLATMVLAAAVWQAVGLGVARVHMLVAGVELDHRTKRGAR
jgi:hypothetical protein